MDDRFDLAARICAAFLLLFGTTLSHAENAHTSPEPRVRLDTLPIVFEPATDATTNTTFLGRTTGAVVQFDPQAFTLALGASAKGARLRVEFAGAKAGARLAGTNPLPSESNYLLGNNPAHWRAHVANFGKLTYTDLYPGIDAVFYGNGEHLEHDFRVAPGADYRRIRLALPESAHASLTREGDLDIRVANGRIQFHRPIIYQEGKQGREPRMGAFRRISKREVGFTVSAYDRRRPLIIDPVLTYSTYLADLSIGSGPIAVDSAGNTYLTGITFSQNYPVTPGAVQSTCESCAHQLSDVYVTKLKADGSGLIYSTFLGGSDYDQPFGIAVDGAGDALITGYSQSTDFPVKHGLTLGSIGNGSRYGFLSSISPDGSSLNYSTLLGGGLQPYQSSTTVGQGVAVDPSGNAYIAGTTDSAVCPVSQRALNQGTPSYPHTIVFASKFLPTGQLGYSALLGDAEPQNGGGGPIGVSGITVDSDGSAYISGQGGSLYPTTPGAYQTEIPGAVPYAAPFITKISPDGSQLSYSTFLGNNGQVTAPVLDRNRNVFVAGLCGYACPVTANAFQATGGSAFFSELNATGSTLLYSSLFVKQGTSVAGIALDEKGDIWLDGVTSDVAFPLKFPLQSVLALPIQQFQRSALFLTEFDPTGTQILFSTLFGNPAAYAEPTGFAMDVNNRAHIAGFASDGLYTSPDAYVGKLSPPPANVEATYGFAAVVDAGADAPALCIPPPANAGIAFGQVPVGHSQAQTITLTSCGTQPLILSAAEPSVGVYTVPPSANGCQQSISPGQSCTLQLAFSPTAKSDFPGSLSFQSNASLPFTTIPVDGEGALPQILVQTPNPFNHRIRVRDVSRS